MYQICANKATILKDCVLDTSDSLSLARIKAEFYLDTIGKLSKSSHARQCICIYIKKDDIILHQFGSR